MNQHASTAAILVAQLFVSSLASGAEDCGTAGTMTVKSRDGKNKILTATRKFPDGSIAVRARLAVNPDGGPASYTVGDHGFTYIANGLSRWNGTSTEQCGSNCSADFISAERADFRKGTPAFCVFAIEVDAYIPGNKIKQCGNGRAVVGDALGRPKLGAMLETVTGAKIQGYLSTTSMKHLVDGLPRYLNSEAIPIAVAPSAEMLGKIVWVGGNGYKPAWAVIGDIGPAFGEGSIALHQLLRNGIVSPQKPGPITRESRCSAAELALQKPFLSRPDGKNDACGNGHVGTSSSDIRAYGAIDDTLDFVILGKSMLASKGSVIQSEVSAKTLAAAAAGYAQERIDHMLSCLPK